MPCAEFTMQFQKTLAEEFGMRIAGILADCGIDDWEDSATMR